MSAVIVIHIPLITGIGLATPLGDTPEATWSALCAGRAIADHARVPDLAISPEARVATLGRHVVRQAVHAAGWGLGQVRSSSLIVGTSKGPVDAWLESLATGVILPQSEDAFGLGDISTSIAREFHIGGPRLTLSAACASGLHALIRAAIMIRSGEVRRVIVVATESSLHPLFLASFERLGVIAPPGHGCRPFDQSRAGFLVSEAAAAVCLEAGDDLRSDARPMVAVERFAMGADATHLTAGDSAGATLRRILATVVDARPVDFIHAHGTGTITHDPIELNAIESVLPCQMDVLPSLYSHKGALGHSLGAAGLVAVAINCLAHRDGVTPPNVHTKNPLSMTRLRMDREVCERKIDRSMVAAAGFGGAIAAVSFVRK